MKTKRLCKKSFNLIRVIATLAIVLFFGGISKNTLAVDLNTADLEITDEKANSATEIKVGERKFKYYSNDPDGKDIAWYKFVPPEDGRYVIKLINRNDVVFGGFTVFEKEKNKYSSCMGRVCSSYKSLEGLANFYAEKDKEYYFEVFGLYNATGDLGIEINRALTVKSVENVQCQKMYSKSGTIVADVIYDNGTRKKLYCDIIDGQIEFTHDEYRNVLSFDSTGDVSNALDKNELGIYDIDVRTVAYDGEQQWHYIKIPQKLEFDSLANIKSSGKTLKKGDVIEATPQGCVYELEKNDLVFVLASENGSKLPDDFRIQVMVFSDEFGNNADVYFYKGNETVVIPSKRNTKVFIRSLEGKAKFKVGTSGYDYSVSSLGLPAQITTKIDSIYDLGNDLIVKPANMGLNRIVWTSSNPAVATVSKSGKLTAIAAGTTDITATVDGKTAICKVTVNRLPQQITDVRVKIDSNSKKYKKNLRITVKKSKLVKNSKKKNNNRKTKICKISAKSKTTVDFKYTSRNNKFSIDKNGNVYVKNRIRKGKYTLKFKLKAPASAKYNVKNKAIQIKVIVK